VKNHYKIGEISKIYGIGRDSLMYYEDVGILKPERDSNSYRLYTMKDIWKLNLIKELRTFNFSMEKIREYIDNRTIKSTKKMLKEEMCLIDNKILDLSRLKNTLDKRIENISYAENSTELNVVKVIYLNERKALRLDGEIRRDEDVDYLVKKLQKKHEDKFYLLGNTRIGAIYNLEGLYKGVYNEYISVFCLLNHIDTNYSLILNEGYYVSLSYKGPYADNKQYIDILFEFIYANNYKIISEPIEIYKIDIHETSLSDEFITEIQIPISK
jgi:DNA-binding transcriptional MerR regulator